MRNLNEICTIMNSKGMKLNSSDFDNGGDFYCFKGVWHDMPLSILYNTFNGKFQVWNGITEKLLATEQSEIDNKEWYSELLNTFYVA